MSVRKVVLVAGGAGAVGRAIALQFADEGAPIILLDVSESRLAATETEVRARGVACLSLCRDISDPSAIAGLTATTRSFGVVRVLVNAAAVLGPPCPAETLDCENWDAVMTVNVRGAWLLSKAMHSDLVESRGRVIHISSTAGRDGSRGLVAYAASKSALFGMTRTLALEWARDGITANVVVPGLIDGGISAGLTREQVQDLSSQIPLGRAAAPSDVAAVVSFLASPGAAYITGSALEVTGGR